ncbi:MAG: ribonuclease HII [Syntrophobacteraceae bacterium]|nr:ribonuclease HII [Syntrophobacteraceae bacterium]
MRRLKLNPKSSREKEPMQRQMFETRAVDMRLHERAACRKGFCHICGIDEAGRGPLAGPVVAAAVILPNSLCITGIDDSKKLTPAQREDLFEKIRACALAIGTGVVDNAEIDRINILQATFRAMTEAVSQLSVPPDFLLIDGPYKLPLSIGQKGIPHGDALSISIAAASIIAKVHRDRLMCRLHQEFPQYGFDSHKGYGTARHYEALRKFGPCSLHRVTFKGVLPCLECRGDADQEPV